MNSNLSYLKEVRILLGDGSNLMRSDHGKLVAPGHDSALGDPQTRNMTSHWSNSVFPWKIGYLIYSSMKMHLSIVNETMTMSGKGIQRILTPLTKYPP